MLKSQLTTTADDTRSTTESPPSKLEPMMWAHLALTGDRAQNARWRSQLEAIRQADAVAHAPDPETKAVLANKLAWRQMRITGRLGATFGLGLGSFWLAWLLPTYAIGHGFGWLAASAFLLPVPLAWRFGRRLWEQASVAGMRDLGERPSMRKRLAVVGRSLFRSFNAGFGFGFSLVFLNALVTWFMTPAPTLAIELLTDGYQASVAGVISGGLSMMLAPIVQRSLPSPNSDGHSLGAGAPLAMLDDD